jgi:CSLREA domain-containing protein
MTLRLCCAITLSLIGLTLHATAQAALYTVTKTADTADGGCDADCSLREAVIAANALPGFDVIRLRHSYYPLTRVGEDDDDNALRGDLDLSDDVQIIGLPDRSSVDARAIDRVLEVLPGVKAELIDVSLRNGRVAGRGGGIYNEGDLTLRRVWVNQNRVTLREVGIVQGGGIYNQGVLRLIFGRVQDNVALDDATLTGGSGGGIYNGAGAQLYLYDTAVRYNRTGLDDASGFGGGLYNISQARIDRSYFGHNDPGDGEGSAIANRAGGSLTLINTTLSGNGHDGASGALANGTLTDPRESLPKASLLNATLAYNNGGGLLNTGRLTMRNTIIGGNYVQDGNDRWFDAGFNCRNLGRGTINEHFSLIGSDGNCPAAISVDNRAIFSLVLEPLRYLGGPTPVHPLRQGPYAIDAGDPLICPERDQRFGRRPADGDRNGSELCDIGAMEVDADE